MDTSRLNANHHIVIHSFIMLEWRWRSNKVGFSFGSGEWGGEWLWRRRAEEHLEQRRCGRGTGALAPRIRTEVGQRQTLVLTKAEGIGLQGKLESWWSL